MKKIIAFGFVIALLLSMTTVSFASSEIEGFSHQTGTWTAVDGGVSATPTNATQHIVLEETLNKGTFEVTLSGEAIGHQPSENGIFIGGTSLDKVTETGVWTGNHIEAGNGVIPGLGYYMIYLNGTGINLCNMYYGRWNNYAGRADITLELEDNGAWKEDNEVVIKVELSENGAIKVYAEGVLMIEYTPEEGASYPTGNQIAFRAMNKNNARESDPREPKVINFTNIKVTDISADDSTGGDTAGDADDSTGGDTAGDVDDSTSGDTAGDADDSTSGDAAGDADDSTGGGAAGDADDSTSGGAAGDADDSTSGDAAGDADDNTSDDENEKNNDISEEKGENKNDPTVWIILVVAAVIAVIVIVSIFVAKKKK